jgi:hypothetical protein
MADQEKDKQMQMDAMLDSLLANYSSAEPRPGLETRILANLREATGREAPAGWWTFRWLWAGAVAAAAIIVAALLLGGHRRVTQPNNIVVHTQQPLPQQLSLPRTADRPAPPRLKRFVPLRPLDAGLAPSQRPQMFPTPTPLSEQERLMFTYLANTPHEVVVAQIQRNDQKEEEAFWKDRDESSAAGRSTTNR